MAGSTLIKDRGGAQQVENALRDTRAHLEGIIASAMDAIITIDEDQRILLFNHAAENMFGYSLEEVKGKPLEILLPEQFRERHRRHIQHFGRTGITNRTMGRQSTIFGKRASGEEFPIEASISQVDIEAGKLFTVILRDVAERVKAEMALRAKNDEIKTMTQQLWQAARLATMGELAASIAHELNNPLAILSLRIESLLAGVDASDPARRELQVMEQEVDRMASLVANLLQFSRSTRRQVSSLDLREEVDKTLELIRTHLLHRHIEVDEVFPENLPLIQADRTQLRQLFLNLFTNASDAMPKGGTLRIRIEPVQQGKNLRIDIEDSGIGIGPAELPQVMEPFYTTKEEGKGTGLGLAICKRIVEEHHGSIQVSSPGIGKGTKVEIVLPGYYQGRSNILEE